MLPTPQTRDTQRNALHSTIWKVANDLRGSVDGWDFKMYVLGMLFYRFISENLAAHINAKQGIDSHTGGGGGEPNPYKI
nr:type I restriction-modification system subunit M N-terminal domain-containing protein [Campylobacter vulpis]MBS4252970.1 hypothetical protein [Campylobacter vulpis]